MNKISNIVVYQMKQIKQYKLRIKFAFMRKSKLIINFKLQNKIIFLQDRIKDRLDNQLEISLLQNKNKSVERFLIIYLDSRPMVIINILICK